MPSAKQLREQRQPLAQRIRELADRVHTEQRDFTAEETSEWERINAEYDALTRHIEIAERAEAVEQQQRQSVADAQVGRDDRDGRAGLVDDDRPTDEDRALAMQAWCRHQLGHPLSRRHREACRRTRIHPSARELSIRLRGGPAPRSLTEARALSAITASGGATTIAEGFVQALEVNLLQYGNVRQVAEVMRTETGAPLPWPTVNDTSNEGELIGENTAQNNADPAFGAITFQAYKFSSKFIRVPAELLEDSAFNLVALLGQMIGERLGRIGNRKFTVGSGANEPRGVLTAAALGKTAAGASAILADELLDLEHSIDPAYRNDRCAWMMHDSTLALIRKLKDGEGRYLWEQSLQVGQPDRILGYPVSINQHMPTVTNSAKTILFGDFSRYKIRDVNTIRLRRLVERFADTDQEGFVGFIRSDGNLLDAGTTPIKYLQQAA
jgi:HK97 family phage major capsid protein